MDLETIQQELEILATNLKLQTLWVEGMGRRYPDIKALMSKAKMIRWSEEELKALKSLLDDTKNNINDVWYKLAKLSDYFGCTLEDLEKEEKKKLEKPGSFFGGNVIYVEKPIDVKNALQQVDSKVLDCITKQPNN